MPASNKILRQNPQQDISKYMLYYVVDNGTGLCEISNNQMTVCSGRAGKPGLVNGPDTETIIDIGFDFLFNNQVYKQIHISPWGWITLDEPSEIATWSFGDFFIDSRAGENYAIRMDMTTKHVLLCPWFEYLRNYCNRKNDLDPEGSGTAIDRTNAAMDQSDSDHLGFGIDSTTILTVYYPQYNPQLTGVRYFRENNSKFGKRLIIRWNSIGNNTISFEVVLYENGRIEFRYCPLSSVYSWPGDDIPPSQASVGIFGKNIFRDFATELKSNTRFLSGSIELEFGYYGEIISSSNYTRQRYDRGGAIFDNNFIDVTLSNGNSGDFIAQNNYTISLLPELNWPGRILQGGMFIFQPQTLKRKILPRNQIKKINTNNINKTTTLFDDRQTLQNTTTQVNFPSKLQRNFAGNTLKTQLFHDFFENGIETSGSNINAYDVYQNTQEVENFTQNNTAYNENSTDFIIDDNLSFFLSGTNTDRTPGFDKRLTTKDKIVIELPLQYSTTLLSTASSMYYYNNSTKSLVLCNKDAGDPLTLNRAQNDIDRYAAPEDYIGFSPVGTLIVSGNNVGILNTGSYNTNLQAQSNKYINASLNEQSYKNALQATYGNSVCVNQNFNATSNQTFTLPITKPFLIEKAIIEVQIEADNNWCTDTTFYQQPFAPDSQIISGTQFVDIGGPVVTCALFQQYNHLNSQYRNLILSSTFSTIYDNTSSYSMIYNSGEDKLQLTTYGLQTVNCNATYVSPNEDWDEDNQVFTTFTGSVKMFTKPQTTSGCIATVRTLAYTSSSATNRTLLSSTLANPFININNISTTPNTTGTTINLHCITNFGKSQTGFIESGQSIFGKEILSNVKIQNFNNLFLGANQEYDYWINQYGAVEKFITTFPISLLKFTDNPYLVFPNQELIFAIAKSRSVVRGTTNDVYYNEQRTHDIKFVSGSNIKITLYGSYIKENKECHNIINNTQENDIYDVIGAEPVLDQFNVFSRKSFFNSYTDLFMSGSLIAGERKKAFNIVNATHEDNFENLQGSYSSTFTKQYEYAGINAYVRLSSINELYFDSCVPDIRQIVKLNTGNQFLFQTIGPFAGLACWLWSDLSASDDWCWSFPFEPRYSSINRLRTLPTEYSVCHTITNVTLSNKVTTIFIILGSSLTLAHYLLDINNGTYVGLTKTDLAKSIFGFGDYNTYNGDSGANHYPDCAIVSDLLFHPQIRGWKYGLVGGLPTYTSCVFNKNHYGYMRDMLEQRQFTAFLTLDAKGDTISRGPVTVQFINPSSGKTTNPENTWSSNLDYYCTSSLPYFDGVARNRPEININNMNLTLNSLSFNDTNITIQ